MERGSLTSIKRVCGCMILDNTLRQLHNRLNSVEAAARGNGTVAVDGPMAQK